MAAVTVLSDSGAQENEIWQFPLFPHLFAMKWWDQMAWSLFLLILSFKFFHNVHAVLNARILKWFAIPFSSGSPFVRTLHHDLSILDGPTWHGSLFHWFRPSLWSMWSDGLVLCGCDFQSFCPLMGENKKLMEASW